MFTGPPLHHLYHGERRTRGARSEDLLRDGLCGLRGLRGSILLETAADPGSGDGWDGFPASRAGCRASVGLIPMALQQLLERGVVAQRVPGGIDLEPGDGDPGRVGEQILELLDRALVVADHDVDLGEVDGGGYVVETILGPRQQLGGPPALGDGLLTLTESGQRNAQRAVEPRILRLPRNLRFERLPRRLVVLPCRPGLFEQLVDERREQGVGPGPRLGQNPRLRARRQPVDGCL